MNDEDKMGNYFIYCFNRFIHLFNGGAVNE